MDPLTEIMFGWVFSFCFHNSYLKFLSYKNENWELMRNYFQIWEMSFVAVSVNKCNCVGPPSVYRHIISALLEAFFVPNALASFLASVFLYSLYNSNFSNYSSHPPLPTYHYFFLLPFLLLLIPLTGSICSQATLNPVQTERKKKPS